MHLVPFQMISQMNFQLNKPEEYKIFIFRLCSRIVQFAVVLLRFLSGMSYTLECNEMSEIDKMSFCLFYFI